MPLQPPNHTTTEAHRLVFGYGVVQVDVVLSMMGCHAVTADQRPEQRDGVEHLIGGRQGDRVGDAVVGTVCLLFLCEPRQRVPHLRAGIALPSSAN